jgi:hypothetical protein
LATFGNINQSGTTTSVSAPPSNNKAVSSFVLDRQGTLDHLLFRFLGTSSTQAQNAKAVIYDNSGVGGLPGALLATSSLVVATGTGDVAFAFPTPPTLNAGTYWAGLIATTGGATRCSALTNGIAFNADTIAGGPSNPFGASPSLASFRYPLVVLYTPVLTAGTAYGQLLGGDALNHNYVANDIIVIKITLPVAGSVSKLTTFVNDAFPSAKGKGVIYDATGGSGGPGNLLGTTNELVGFAINGNDLTFASPVSLAAGDYYIGLHTDTTMNVCHLVDSTPNAVGVRTYTSGVPSTFPSSPTLGTGSWSLWATFAANSIRGLRSWSFDGGMVKVG